MPVRRREHLVTDAQLVALLARYEAGTKVEGGVIQFAARDWEELEQILPDAFDVDPAFTSRQVRMLFREALRNCRKEGPLTVQRVATEAQRLAKEQISQPLTAYSSWSKFRARDMVHHESFSLSWNGVSLESASRLPEYMRLSDYFLNGHGDIEPEKLTFFGYLIAKCDARTEENAVDKIVDAIDIFMSVFNLYRFGDVRVYGFEFRPEAVLWNGPYQFMFRGEEFLSGDAVWFTPDFDEESWGVHPSSMREILSEVANVQRVLDLLSQHPMREILLRILRLIQGAMSSRDQSHRLLRYWSALEQLYGEPQSSEKSYGRIIQRAIFAEQDKETARWKLSHASRIRNEYVHARDRDDDCDVMAQFLRGVLFRHINYLLGNREGFASHREWLDFVDLPSNEEMLNSRKQLIDKRIDLINRSRR